MANRPKFYNVTENDIYELASFISGQYIDRNNFCYLGEKIKKVLLEMQPELNVRIIITKSDLFPFINNSSS